MLKFSTDLVNFLQAGGSFKEAFEDAILTIYSGSQPANADASPTGTKLVEITLNGGSFSYGTDYSLPQIDEVTVTAASSGTNTVTIDSIDISDTTDGTETVDDIAKRLVRKIETNKNTAQKVIPIYIGSGKFVLRSKLAGESYTLSVTGNLSTSSVQSHSRANGLHFGSVSSGQLDKESGTWQGDGLTDGTAGWFRLQGKISTLVIDGNVGTYGADLNLASTNITSGNPVTIDTFSVTQPKSS
ncbi:hypothetical protein DRN93_01235 [archaeon]|nr:MAG: hypothetical protein DRN93_01235 [archaeon]